MLTNAISELANVRQIGINLHITGACDMRCNGCFARFGHDDRNAGANRVQSIAESRWLQIIDRLADEFVTKHHDLKITFVGGEPLLVKYLPRLMAHAKARGATTCVVTNGFRLQNGIDKIAEVADWIGLSVDSTEPKLLRQIGRVASAQTVDYLRLAEQVHSSGCRLKINTVVSSVNHHTDMTAAIEQMGPERWKVFRFLPVIGENEYATDMVITSSEYSAFIQKHLHLKPVVEDNHDMRRSYLMVDPAGYLLDDSNGDKRPLLNLLSPQTESTANPGFELQRYLGRDGAYQW